MAQEQLQGAHIAAMADAACGHAMAQAVQRDSREAETGHQDTVRLVEAGRCYAVDVAGQLAGSTQPGHEAGRDRDGTDAGSGLWQSVNDLAGIEAQALIAHVDLGRVPGHVIPAQAADLTATQTQIDCQRQCQAVTVIDEGGGIGGDLIVGPCLGRALDVRGPRHAPQRLLGQIAQRRGQYDIAQLRGAGVATGCDLGQAWPDVHVGDLVNCQVADDRVDVQTDVATVGLYGAGPYGSGPEGEPVSQIIRYGLGHVKHLPMIISSGSDLTVTTARQTVDIKQTRQSVQQQTGTSSSTTTTVAHGARRAPTALDFEAIRTMYVDVLGALNAYKARDIEWAIDRGLEVSAVLDALEQTALAPRPSHAYLRAILRRYVSEGIYTEDDAERDRRAYSYKRELAARERSAWYDDTDDLVYKAMGGR